MCAKFLKVSSSPVANVGNGAVRGFNSRKSDVCMHENACMIPCRREGLHMVRRGAQNVPQSGRDQKCVQTLSTASVGGASGEAHERVYMS